MSENVEQTYHNLANFLSGFHMILGYVLLNGYA